MKKARDSPPAPAAWILKRISRAEERSSIYNDFYEIYSHMHKNLGRRRAAGWYWAQIIKSIPMFIKAQIYWSTAMLINYLKTTIRILKRNMVFSFINIFGLAVGIALFLLIYQYISFEKSYDTFHENSNQIYRVRNDRVYVDITDGSAGCPPAVGPALKMEFPEILESVRIYNTDWTNNVVSIFRENQPGGRPETVLKSFNQDQVYFVESSFFKIFSFPLIFGSTETALQEPNTVVLSQSASQKYFGAENPVGRFLSVSNNYFGKGIFEVTGVIQDAPTNSHIKFELLLAYDTLIARDERAAYYWGWNAFNTYVLLSPSTDPKTLEAKLPGLVKKYDDPSEDYTRNLYLQPIKDIHLKSKLRFEPETNGDARSIYFLSVIAAFILLIAWMNYINLSTARSTIRAREVGIRKTLGSLRSQLIKQFILESALINILSLLLAVILILLVQPYFNRLTGKPLAISCLGGSWFWLFIAFGTGLLCSAGYPAFILSSFRPVKVLRGRMHQTSKGSNLRKILVIFQFAASIVLIAATLTVYQQISYMQSRDLGMEIDRIIIVKTPINEFNTATLRNVFKQELLNHPAVRAVAISSSIPAGEYSNAASGIRPLASNPEDGKRCFFIDVDTDFFDFYGIKLLAGQPFSEKHQQNKAIIMNETATKMFGFEKPEQAVNKKIILGGLGGQIVETVGVIKDYHHKSLRNPIDPIIYNPLDRIRFFSIKQGSGSLTDFIKIIKEAWKTVFKNQPLEYFFLDESFNHQYQADRQFGKVFGLFSVFAILVSCMGLFGLTLFTAAKLRKEIGVRKVLGASVSGLIFHLSKEFTQSVFYANLFALPIAWLGMNKWLENYAYRIDLGWEILLLSGAVVMIIALSTVSFQAARTASINPVDVLKYE